MARGRRCRLGCGESGLGSRFLLSAGCADQGIGLSAALACEPVAQSVEHLTFNQRVAGSNPAGLTFDFEGVFAPWRRRLRALRVQQGYNEIHRTAWFGTVVISASATTGVMVGSLSGQSECT
jgi:hypothetical protein